MVLAAVAVAAVFERRSRELPMEDAVKHGVPVNLVLEDARTGAPVTSATALMATFRNTWRDARGGEDVAMGFWAPMTELESEPGRYRWRDTKGCDQFKVAVRRQGYVQVMVEQECFRVEGGELTARIRLEREGGR